MLSRDPTYLGMIAAVSGAALNVHLAESIASGLSIFKGQTYKVGQVGSFIRVPQGYQDLFGLFPRSVQTLYLKIWNRWTIQVAG